MSATQDTRRERAVEEASEWMVRLQDPQLPDADLQAWLSWMEASPVHAKAFDDLGRLWELAGTLTSADVLEARAAAAAPPAPVVAPPRHVARPRPRRRWLASVAAVLALMLVGGYVWRMAPVAEPFSTALGERRHVVLDDGSAIDLDASSAVRVTYRPHGRYLALLRGRAYFTVAHDPARPFEVTADKIVSVALGTRFSVDRRADDSVAVTVAEGRVRVSQADAPASPGRVVGHDQQLHAVPGRALAPPQAVDSELALGWRQGRMTYHGEPLASVIADLNRYSRVPVRLEDPSMGSVKVTGLWDSTRTDHWIEGLASALGLRVVRERDGIVLARRAQR